MSTLISRFDLIFILTDDINEVNDHMSADHVLNQVQPKTLILISLSRKARHWEMMIKFIL